MRSSKAPPHSCSGGACPHVLDSDAHTCWTVDWDGMAQGIYERGTKQHFSFS
jgi:hypothetical protein